MPAPSSSFRIAHLSDLHFWTPCWNPIQFFSKRWLGNANSLLLRRREHGQEQLHPLPSLWKTLGVDLVAIAGDLTTTSTHSEFAQARSFVDEVRSVGCDVVLVPGNHDHYTRSAYRNKVFYKELIPEPGQGTWNLQEHGVEVRPLPLGWRLVLLDTAIATPWTSSAGAFLPEIEERLQTVLSEISPRTPILLVNHFPLFNPGPPSHGLERAERLQRLLQEFPNVRLYLHGHTHRHAVADLRGSGLPILSDSGSATHTGRGRWNLWEINEKGCRLECYAWQNGQWERVETLAYHW